MAKITNMFREFSISHIDGYQMLSNYEKSLFETTYKKHLASTAMEERINYSECNIKKIEKKKIEEDVSLLKVHFTNDIYYYLPDNKWIQITSHKVY